MDLSKAQSGRWVVPPHKEKIAHALRISFLTVWRIPQQYTTLLFHAHPCTISFGTSKWNSTCRRSSKSSARYVARKEKRNSFWAQNDKALEFTFADPGDKGSNVCSDLLATRNMCFTCASQFITTQSQRNTVFCKDVAQRLEKAERRLLWRPPQLNELMPDRP